MATDASGIDRTQPPFDGLTRVEPLGADRSGRDSAHARHQLYTARHPRTRTNVLVKVMTKPGVVYERNLLNETATLTTLNRELPDSRFFPFVYDHGRRRDGRVYLVTTLFDELPLATTIGPDRMPSRLVSQLRTTLEVTRALIELHGLRIYHVDLNPMNILLRTGSPVIRIIDFESSYEVARHAGGEFYDPPTTPGFSAPEVPAQAPDARTDLYSLGAVLYTMLAGYDWTWDDTLEDTVGADAAIDAELRDILLKAVARDPGRRYGSVTPFQSALGAYLERIWPGRSW